MVLELTKDRKIMEDNLSRGWPFSCRQIILDKPNTITKYSLKLDQKVTEQNQSQTLETISTSEMVYFQELTETPPRYRSRKLCHETHA